MTTALSLDDLLAESMSEQAQAQEAKAARSAIANGYAAPAERDALQAVVRHWEARREWLPAAAVVMFTRQRCQCCGEYSVQFAGFFQRQTHRQSKIDRWIPADRPHDQKLPRESKYQDSLAVLCEACAEADGFEVEE